MAFVAPFDPFEALGIPRDASSSTIKARYRELARRYHPNRHQGSDESKATLVGHFHMVHQAYCHLRAPEKQRRALELLRLADEQEAILLRMADLLAEDEQKGKDGHSPRQDSPHMDGHFSSDADEDDLPHIAGLRRRTTLDRPDNDTTSLASIAESPEASSPSVRARSRDPSFQAPTLETEETEDKDGDYFTKRRKKLEKLRRIETTAFFQYRDAMMAKFEAELYAERQKELYERAQWKRGYFERAPRQTTERMRSFQHFMGAIRAFSHQQGPSRRRKRSTVSYTGQILSTGYYDSSQFLTAENAPSPSKIKSLHRRGWSSDISGDQTSSDENSSGHATPRPGSPWTRDRRHHSRHSSLEAFLTPSSMRRERSTSPRIPDHEPFRMVVRQPTGLGGIIEDHSSGPESDHDHGSSRSPSPKPDQRQSDLFSLISQAGTVRGLGIDWPSLNILPSSKVHDMRASEPASTFEEPCHFLIKQVGQVEWRHVPIENVHELNFNEKAWMLHADTDVEAEPAELLQRLDRLDPLVCGKFMIKTDIKEAFRFRLIYNYRQVTMNQHHSFIALSYRRRIHVQNREGRYTLPLDDEMFQAVWDERSSDQEGVWIDQICIDQDSRQETTISMSAMDMVYRSARLIVVVLDDVQLDSHEGEILENHMAEYVAMRHVDSSKRFRGKQPPYLETHNELYDVLLKLLSSAWFRRAWCRHEMRLARDHVFLVPCKNPGTWSGRSVVKFTSHCLAHVLALATEVPFENDIELVKPALNAFFRDRAKIIGKELRLRDHHGNFTTVVAEVFGMETGGDPRIPAKQRASDARKDKVSIILNTMECGLALTAAMREPRVSLSTAECHYMLLMLALAARDPGALCSVGPPMRLMQPAALSPNASSTWLFEPTNVDSGLNNYRTLKRLPIDASVSTGLHLGEHFVQLDLKFLRSGKVSHGIDDEDNLDLAQRFIAVCNKRHFGRNRKRYLVADQAANRHFGDMKEVYTQTLACVFECGPDWMGEVCQRYGVSRWKQDSQAAWELLIALKNTGGKWPEQAWTKEAAGFIMDFINFLIIRGLPQRQILHREQWRPIWIATQSGGKVLTFVPPGNIQTAVPVALLDPNYLHLARLWVVEPRLPSYHGHSNQMTGPEEWTLSGKSVLFSDEVALDELHSSGVGVSKHRQKVFGREDPEIQRLLRERSLHF